MRFAPNRGKALRASLSKDWKNSLVSFAAGQEDAGAPTVHVLFRRMNPLHFFTDKIYEARHAILQLTTPMVVPEIPSTYFASNNQDTNNQLCQRTLASMLSRCPESPLTPGVSNNFGLNTNNSPFAAYQSKLNHCSPQLNQYQQQQFTLELPRLQNLKISPNHLNRFLPSAIPNEKNYLAANSSMLPFSLPVTPAPATSFSRCPSLSPIKSTPSANTSGYESFSSTANSLEQSYAPYQPNMHASTSGSSAHLSPANHSFLPSNMSRRMSDSRSSFTLDNECRSSTPAFELTVSFNNNKMERIDCCYSIER